MESGWKCSSNAALCQNPMECRECSLNQSCQSCVNKFTETCGICRNREGLSEVLSSILVELERYRENGTVEEFREYKGLCGPEEINHMKSLKCIIQRFGTIGKIIEECAGYKKIGTISECREAMEKQRAKKYERGLDKEVRCPICGTFTTDIYEHRFCSYCGQRLE